MKNRISPWVVTISLTILAWIITYSLSLYIAPSIFIMFVAAVGCASYYGGHKHGLVVVLLVGLINFFFPPAGDTIPNFLIRYFSFFATTFIVSGLVRRRYEAEAALAIEIEKSKAITNSVNEAIISIDRDSKIVFANPASEEMFGYAPHELIGQPLEVLMPVRYRARHREGFNRYLKTGKRTFEWKKIKLECLRRDGTEVPVDLSFSEYILGTDRMFTAVIRDMTDERRLEVTAAATKMFYENVKDYAMFVLDENGVIQAWNKTSDGVYGYSHEEMVGKSARILYPNGDFEEKWEREKKVALSTGKFEATEIRKRKDGTTFSAFFVLTPLYEEGKLKGFLKLVRDVTEYIKHQEEIQRKAQELEAANRSKDNFLAVLSHELRNPLVSILGYSNMLLSGRLDPSNHRKAIETIARNAKLQVEMIEDLLDISKIISGKVMLKKEVFPICEVVHQAVESYRPHAKAKGITLTENYREKGLFVDGDKRRMNQVFLNLLSNALKFTDPGGTITVSVYCENNQAVVEVSDTGIGISAEALPHIFDRFRHSNPADTRKHGGLGLGLSIVKSVMDLHGGRVTAESGGAGKGATFTVRISDCEGNPEDVPNFEEIAEINRAAKVRLDGIKLLVVDDSDEARQLLTDLFKIYGAMVISAESAAEAREKVKEHGDFNVFVLDIGMPGENGYSLIKSLREMGFKSPALALTAFVGSEYEDAAKKAGFDDYVPKPPSITYLIKRIAELAKENLEN